MPLYHTLLFGINFLIYGYPLLIIHSYSNCSFRIHWYLSQWYNLTLCFSFCGSLPFFLRPHTSFPVDYEQPKAEDFPGLSAVNATEAIFGPTELKVGLKLNIQKTRIMASGPITSWQIDGETVETVADFIFLGSKITADGDCSHEIKRHLLLGRKAMTNLDSILKSRDITLLTKVHLVKAMVFPVTHKGSWALKNWCFWTVVLEMTLESPLDRKETQPVNPKGNQSWVFIGKTDTEAPIFWPPNVRNWIIGKDPDAGKDWRQEEKGMTEDEMVG